jgi:hypothetical protein
VNEAVEAPRIQVPAAVLRDTFALLRRCGAGQRECQIIWIGPWSNPTQVTEVIHPDHRAHAGAFELDDSWLTRFWLDLARTGCGARVQVHTHPGRAFHSITDDAFPLIHTPGFLSLVVPDFAAGPVGLHGAYLAQLTQRGKWRQLQPHESIEVIGDVN